MPLSLGPADEVGDHEEVAREAHLLDDVDLVSARGPGASVGDAVREALMHAQPRPLSKNRSPRSRPSGTGNRGMRLRVLEADIDALGDQQRVVAGLGVVAEHGAHLRRGLEVELLGVELEPVGVVERRAGLHAQQRRVVRRRRRACV